QDARVIAGGLPGVLCCGRDAAIDTAGGPVACDCARGALLFRCPLQEVAAPATGLPDVNREPGMPHDAANQRADPDRLLACVRVDDAERLPWRHRLEAALSEARPDRAP